jgi:peptidyl-prolyl cis-trans isomerase SurA
MILVNKLSFHFNLSLMMKKISTALITMAFSLVMLFVNLSDTRAQPVELDKIVAVVEDDVVLKSEFNQRLGQIEAQLAQSQGPKPPVEEVKKQLMDQLIIENLQLQQARRAGIRIDDNQLNQYMAFLAQQNNMDFEQFRKALESQGIYQSTREAIRKEIIINQYQNAAVNRRIEISRQEVENYLRSEVGLQQIAPEYHVGHILITSNSGNSNGDFQVLAEVLAEQVRDGENILSIAARGQVNGIPISGGDLGFRKPEDLPSIFQELVPTLSAGEVSDPFTSSSGYHIVQLIETRGGTELKVQQYHVRHILVKPNEIRTDDQAKILIEELYARIQKGEDFADIARQHTEDAQSMVSGGDLDWVGKDNVPEDFMTAIENSELNKINPPVRLSSGWHIIEVMEERVEDVTEDNKRFQAQRILRERKYENELQNWLTEIRDTSHVEIFDY